MARSHGTTPPSYHVVHVCDVHHFTNIAAELGDGVGDFLDEMYGELGEIGVRGGGSVLGYLGDSMLFLYGAGAAEHLQAVRGALAMRRAFARLLSRYDIRSRSELENGISAGNLVHRIVGHPTLRLPQAFGVAVNEAAILGCHRGVAVTASVKPHIEGCYATRRLPDVVVTWSDQPLAAWEIVDPGALQEP